MDICIPSAWLVNDPPPVGAIFEQFEPEFSQFLREFVLGRRIFRAPSLWDFNVLVCSKCKVTRRVKSTPIFSDGWNRGMGGEWAGEWRGRRPPPPRGSDGGAVPPPPVWRHERPRPAEIGGPISLVCLHQGQEDQDKLLFVWFFLWLLGHKCGPKGCKKGGWRATNPVPKPSPGHAGSLFFSGLMGVVGAVRAQSPLLRGGVGTASRTQISECPSV